MFWVWLGLSEDISFLDYTSCVRWKEKRVNVLMQGGSPVMKVEIYSGFRYFLSFRVGLLDIYLGAKCRQGN